MNDAPERIWADEDTWFAGTGKTERAQEYVRADIVAALIREAEARGMERAADYLDVAEHDAQERNWQSGANAFDALSCAIRAEAAAIRGDTE